MSHNDNGADSFLSMRYIGRAGRAVEPDDDVASKFVELLPKEGGVLMKTMADGWIEIGCHKGSGV